MAWTSEQRHNAKIIIQQGKRMGMRQRDIQIALMTAMQESTLRSLDYGDRDSLGLFQQRPSMGWGSPSQVKNPWYASRKFYQTLRHVSGRDSMKRWEVAQAVQRSGFPTAYAKWADDARGLYSQLAGGMAGSFQGSQQNAPTANTSTRPSILAEGGEPDDGTGVSEVIAPGLETPSHPGAESPEEGGAAASAPGAGDATEPIDFTLPSMNPKQFQESIAASWGSDAHKAWKGDLLGDLGLGGGHGGGGSALGRKAVRIAANALGTRYVWGGTNLNRGVDCSGLIYSAYKRAGITLPRVSYQQANYGKRVSLGSLRPGDLVAWDNSSRSNGADHIAIYAGHGSIIEAPRPGLSVRKRKLGKHEGAWGVRLPFL